jgi:hypothetical protein
MKKLQIFATALLIFFACSFATQSFGQIKLEDFKDLNIGDILGKTKVLKVKKGFSPVFSIGNYQINTVGLLGEK